MCLVIILEGEGVFNITRPRLDKAGQKSLARVTEERKVAQRTEMHPEKGDGSAAAKSQM